MSKQNVNEFYAMLCACADLRDDLDAMVNQSKLLDAAVQIGEEVGFEFTASEMNDFLSGFDSDEPAEGIFHTDIENIPGGGNWSRWRSEGERFRWNTGGRQWKRRRRRWYP